MEMDQVQEGPTARRPKRANELGATGVQVAANVKRLREDLPLTTEQLAARVTELGRPMGAATITKIEKRQRRVDSDDLVALSLALETRPDALLLPPTITGDGIKLTDTKTVPALAAWLWVNGKRPIDVPKGDDGAASASFQIRAQPPGLRLWNVTTPAGMIAAAAEDPTTPPEKMRELREVLGQGE